MLNSSKDFKSKKLLPCLWQLKTKFQRLKKINNSKRQSDWANLNISMNSRPKKRNKKLQPLHLKNNKLLPLKSNLFWAISHLSFWAPQKPTDRSKTTKNNNLFSESKLQCWERKSNKEKKKKSSSMKTPKKGRKDCFSNEKWSANKNSKSENKNYRILSKMSRL